MIKNNLNEPELIQQCLANQAAAQKQLYDTYKSKMMGVVLRYVRHREDADDIFQEAFIRVFKNLHTLSERQALGGWIKMIVVNTAINHYQANKKFKLDKEVEALLDSSDDSFPKVLSSLYAADLLKLVQKLPDAYRLVFNLYVIDGYKHSEIADLLHVSESTSRSTLARAKEKIRNQLAQSGNSPPILNLPATTSTHF
jgi:RNA polymerase sigma factor (sigma-70 family)